MSNNNPFDFKDISGNTYSDFFNDEVGLGFETVTEPIDEEWNENKDKNVKHDNGTALEKRTNVSGLLPMQTKETNQFAKALGSSSQIEKHVQANQALLESCLLKLPDNYIQDTGLEPESRFSDEAVKIFESIPSLAWAEILVLVGVLAYLNALRDILIAGVCCALAFPVLNSWLSKAKNETVAQRNKNKGETIQALEAIKANVMKSYDENVLRGHEMTLKTVENVENIRAEVTKYQTKAADIMHERETKKDLRIQEMTQTGLKDRALLNSKTVLEATKMKTDTEMQVKTVEAETVQARTKAEQLMEENRLKNDLLTKQLDVKSQEAMKQLDINFQTLIANLRADLDKARINADKDTQLAKEENATKRLDLQQNCELERVRSSNQVEVVKAQEETKRVQSKNERKKCIIA